MATNSTGVYQKDNGYWEYRFVMMVDGKQVNKKKSTDAFGNKLKTKREAIKARETAMAAARSGVTEKPKVRRRTFREVFEEYCEKGRKDRAYQTIRKQDSIWENHLLSSFGSRYVNEISVAEVMDYLAELSATSNSTYLSPVDDKTMYGASIGKILMIPAFTMTNKDRAGSMSVCGGDWAFNWKIGYEGTEYPVFGFDLNFDNSAVKMTPGCIIDPLTEYNTEKHDSSNYLLFAGETVSMRIVTVANFEPADLTDGFELRISLPNASGELEDFIYVIPDANAPLEESQQTYIYDKVSQLIEQEEYYAALENLALLGDYKDSVELYDFCMRRYAAKVGMWNIAEEYLIENMDSFTQITGDTLKEIIPGNSWYLQGVGSNGWKYLEDGTIDDGWGNDRGWSVEGDLLVIRTKNNYTKVSVLELYDGGYVLLENGEYYATLYKVENE